MIGACNTLWKKTGYVGWLPFSYPLMKSSTPCGCPVPSSKNSCHWVCLSRVVASSMNCCMEPITCTWLLVNAAPVPTTLSRLSPPSHARQPLPCCLLGIFAQEGLQPLCLASTPAMWFDSRSHGFVLLFCTRSHAWKTCAVKRFAPFQRGFAVRHRPFYRFSINVIG